jgi:transcriptional regulator with XRE-family HTH domain
MQITLKAARTNSNLTQQEACKMLGITQATLSKYENGISIPSVHTTIRMSKLYNINHNDINFFS